MNCVCVKKSVNEFQNILNSPSQNPFDFSQNLFKLLFYFFNHNFFLFFVKFDFITTSPKQLARGI